MAPLNAEPAQPEERKKQHLPPKSYANAVEEDPPVNSANVAAGGSAINGGNSMGANGANGVGDGNSKSTTHTASVLRIVDTGVPETKENKEERPQFERQESNQEYSAPVCIVEVLI
jgi:2-acylglycerol O-acyltransferase 2